MEPIATFNEDFPSFAKVDSDAEGKKKRGDMTLLASRHFTNSDKLGKEMGFSLFVKRASTTTASEAAGNNRE